MSNGDKAQFESITDQRLRNLVAIIDTRFHGNAAALARVIDRRASWVSQAKNRHRRIGERMARHIERSLGLREGSLDKDANADDEVDCQIVEKMDPLASVRQLHEQGWLNTQDLAVINTMAQRLADKAREGGPF